MQEAVNKRDEKGVGSRGQERGGGRLGAHRSSRLVMALHCGGRVPVSWLFSRYLRTGGGHAYAGGCKQKGLEGGGLKRTRAGRGAAWRSQVIQIGHGAPLRREGPRELVGAEGPAASGGVRVCRGLYCKQKGREGGGLKLGQERGGGGLALTGNPDWSWRSTAEGGSP